VAEIAGKKISNWWLIGGGVGIVVVFYLYKKGGLGLGSSSSASGSSATDPVTGLPYSEDNTIDPTTGMTYLQEAQEYGSVSAAEQAVSSGAGLLGTGQAAAVDSGFPTISQVSGEAPVGASYSTDAQWAQSVTAGLTDLGYSPTDIAAALGLYFQSQPLGSGADGVSYLSIVQAAIAEFGPPPVGTFPLVGTGGSGTGTGTGKGTPPPVKKPAAAPSGLDVISQSPTLITADWRPVSGATAYELQVTPRDSAPHNIGARTSYNVGSLKPKTKYTVHVAAVNSGGTGPYATKTITTR
jgi:hypothetical protein